MATVFAGLAWVGMSGVVRADASGDSARSADAGRADAEASGEERVPAPPVAEEEDGIVEALVAVVGGETPSATTDVVLLSDVELVASLAMARNGQGDRSPTDAVRAAALDQLLGEILLRREAERLHADEPPPEAIAEQRLALARSVGGEAALFAIAERLAVPLGELDAIARRHAIVQRFLSANLEGATEITEADVDRAYTEAAHPFAGRPLDEVRDALRAWLQVQQLDHDVRRWLGVLRQRTTVHIVRPFVSAPASASPDAPPAPPAPSPPAPAASSERESERDRDVHEPR